MPPGRGLRELQSGQPGVGEASSSRFPLSFRPKANFPGGPSRCGRTVQPSTGVGAGAKRCRLRQKSSQTLGGCTGQASSAGTPRPGDGGGQGRKGWKRPGERGARHAERRLPLHGTPRPKTAKAPLPSRDPPLSTGEGGLSLPPDLPPTRGRVGGRPGRDSQRPPLRGRPANPGRAGRRPGPPRPSRWGSGPFPEGGRAGARAGAAPLPARRARCWLGLPGERRRRVPTCGARRRRRRTQVCERGRGGPPQLPPGPAPPERRLPARAHARGRRGDLPPSRR